MLWDRIREARKRAGLTQQQLAEQIGVAKSTYNGYETGNSEPDMVRLSRIMDVLRVDANFLLQDEMKEYRAPKNAMSAEELSLVSLYRGLDAHGKRLVNMVVGAENERCEEAAKLSSAQPEVSEFAPIRTAPRFSMPVYNEPAAAGNPLEVGSDFEYILFEEDVVPEGADFGVRIKGDSMGESVPDGCIAFVRKAQRAEDGDIVIAWIDGEGTVCKRFVGEGDRLLYLKSDNESYPDITGDALIGLRIYGVVVGYTEQSN